MAARRAIALVIAGAAAGAVATAVMLVRPGVARADMAFPSSLQVLLPTDRPQEIALATNFGLILSEDGGATWQWTCEQPQTFGASGYAVGPAPQDRYFAVSMSTGVLAYSDDGSCTWSVSGGTLTQAAPSDYFPDPTNPSRVLALGTSQRDGGPSVGQVYASNDGGMTFGPAIYTAPASAILRGVEIARSDPATVYVALYTSTPITVDGGGAFQNHPQLARSTDGGATFTTLDLEPLLGQVQFGIMAVDPANARKIYLRVIDSDHNQESVAISSDGGGTFTTPVTVAGGALTAFARLASGTVLVGAEANAVTMGFRSADGGATFQPWNNVPHFEALAERSGKLYVAAKNYTDGWALGVSTDEGITIKPIISYDKVSAMKACVRNLPVCMDSCENVAGRQIWSPAVCGDNVTPPPTPKSGCGCALARPRRAGGAAVGLAVAALAIAARRRRGRRA
jgi:hypothetical protein